MNLKTTLSTLALLVCFTSTTIAQQVKAPVDTTITSTHSVTIKGQNIPYKAELGFQPVWDNSGNPVATLNSVSYTHLTLPTKRIV